MKHSAKWITSPTDGGAAALTYRKDFRPAKEVKKATLSVSSLGIYAAYLDGVRLGKNILTPGWTSYQKRIQYQTYDITAALRAENRLEIGLGQGWALSYIGYARTNHHYGDRTALIAWLDLTYTDGTHEEISTDESWEVYTSPVLSSEIYHGETVDKTAPITRLGNAVLTTVKTKLVPQIGEEITEQERLAPVAVIHTPKGETVLDFGQNMTGYVEVSVKAPRGSRIVLHHGEVLDKNGNFFNNNYRSARNENIYVCSGEDDIFKPTYTFQGFRYVRLTEYPLDSVDPACFRAVAVNSDLRRTGHFVCGNEKINQLYHNVIWGQKSNYLDIPTDCPQRDERLGWTGDAQVFCRTAAINFDVERFFKKWLGDVALEQAPNGAVGGVIPDCMLRDRPTRVSAAWGDACCVIPWQLYLAYGNKKLLKDSFPMMKKWVDYLHSTEPQEFLWLGGTHYGDWLAMDAGEDGTDGLTSKDLIASAFFAYSTSLVVQAGEVLGKDMSEYRTLYGNVRAAFRDYFMENGMPKEEIPASAPQMRGEDYRRGITQTALVLILHFGLCEEHEKPALVAKLTELIHARGDRMATGFVGTPYLLHVLSENGETELAYKLLFQEKMPSWLYTVNLGATTMWERWNSLAEDGRISTSMNSFNHYAYGSVFDWIFGVAVGIKPVWEDPAYKTVTIAPHPHRGLGFAKASIDSRNGEIGVHWYYKGDVVYYELEIPAGVTARLTLPSGYTATLGGGSYRFAE